MIPIYSVATGVVAFLFANWLGYIVFIKRLLLFLDSKHVFIYVVVILRYVVVVVVAYTFFIFLIDSQKTFAKKRFSKRERFIFSSCLFVKPFSGHYNHSFACQRCLTPLKIVQAKKILEGLNPLNYVGTIKR